MFGNSMLMAGGSVPPVGFAYLMGNQNEEIWGTNDFLSFTRVHNTPTSPNRSYRNLTSNGSGKVWASYGLNTTSIYVSDDYGATWVLRTTSAAASNEYGVLGAYNPNTGLLMAPTPATGGAVSISTDAGVNWTRVATNLGSTGSIASPFCFYASGQNRYYSFSANEANFSHSLDTILWTRVASGAAPVGMTYSPLANLVFGVNATGAVRSYSPTVTTLGNCGVTGADALNGPSPMACNPVTGRLLVVGATGTATCATSDDNGATWTARTRPAFTPWAACWLPSLNAFVVVGAGGNIAISPNGETWTSIVNVSLGTLVSICGTQDMTI